MKRKVALVTGAATGIGASLASALAEAGLRVFGADIAWDPATESKSYEQVHCDVADAKSVQECVDRIEEEAGGVDVLVNNAAMATELSPRPFDQLTPEEWTRVLTVNTLSQFLCCKAVVPHMRRKRWGRIINLTSATVFAGTPYMLHYIASKGAIVAMTRSLGAELGPDGITVNAIAPGLTETAGIQRNDAYSDEMKAGVIASRAIARAERAEDLVGTCLFLAGEGARFITGQIVVVDGGATFH